MEIRKGVKSLRQKLTLLVIFLLVLVFAASQVMAVANWTAQTSGATIALTSVRFVDENNGWAVGENGTILHTGNSGTNWAAQTSGTTSTLQSVYFINASTGWAVGQSGTILHTTNGGANWAAQTSGTTSYFNSVRFTDANNGWAVGTGGTILHTTNGGTNWAAQTSGTMSSLASVDFVNATTGWATGFGGTILHTTNGGANWSAQTSGVTSFLTSVRFVNANSGWAVGDSGTILHSTNGGTNWATQSSGTSKALSAIDFLDANNGWAVGQSGTILHTTNGGADWVTQTSGTGEYLLSVDFINARPIVKPPLVGSEAQKGKAILPIITNPIGWAVGFGGTILKNQETGGGTTTTQPTSTSTTVLGTTTTTQPGSTSTTVLGTTTTTNPSVTFKDVSPTDWFFTYVRDLVAAGVINGYPDNTFRPQNSITRAEFAKTIILATGNTPSTATGSSFSDVAPSYWAHGYIERAKERGFISGYPDGTFKPEAKISRQEIAKVVVLANGSTPATSFTARFSDVPQSLWSWPYVLKAADLGIVSGYPGGLFKPINAATRAEASKMVKVMIDAAP